ncbi:MAG: hypothetical protein OXN84_16015 [Albidovulum sp.]|nr:hypothetical protein [Albidovulum sp.]
MLGPCFDSEALGTAPLFIPGAGLGNTESRKLQNAAADCCRNLPPLGKTKRWNRLDEQVDAQ